VLTGRLANQAEKNLFRANKVVAETTSFFLSKHNHFNGLLGEPFEHHAGDAHALDATLTSSGLDGLLNMALQSVGGGSGAQVQGTSRFKPSKCYELLPRTRPHASLLGCQQPLPIRNLHGCNPVELLFIETGYMKSKIK
jgi:hypothetical protein